MSFACLDGDGRPDVPRSRRWRPCAALLLACALAGGAAAAPQTVCTITINSADEREALKRQLPPDRYRFVELVDETRPDWLDAACRAGVRCDVLVVSGHFDDGSEFYGDRLDRHARLPVADLERAACSASCGGVFAQLKEVYLFGCNTLGREPLRYVSGEGLRSLQREGRDAAAAAEVARDLEAKHGESNRDRMRAVFKDVPVVYGFASKAPLGASAGPALEQWLKAGGAGEVGRGVASAQLLAQFAAVSMQAAAGVTDADVQSGHRRDVCALSGAADAAASWTGLHTVLRREAAEAEFHLDRLDALAATLAADDSTPAATQARNGLVVDTGARDRFLATARDADRLATTARMLDVAHHVGWLSEADVPRELIASIDERARRRALDPSDVAAACAAAEGHALDAAVAALSSTADYPATAANAATLACLGREDARARALAALTGASDADADAARVLLRQRRAVDAADVRTIAAAIAATRVPEAQVRALDALAALRVDDRASLEALAALYPRTRSAAVQRAIAGVLLRADLSAVDTGAMAHALRAHRVAAPGSPDAIDVLLRRLPKAS